MAEAPVYCQYGTEIKPSVSEHAFYVTAADAFDQISLRLGLLAPFVNVLVGQIAPRYVDLTATCGRVPPVPPTVDLQSLFLSGQWAVIPEWVVTWFWAIWENEQWNTFCQCTQGQEAECRSEVFGTLSYSGNGYKEIRRWDPMYNAVGNIHFQADYDVTSGGWSPVIQFIRTDGTLSTIMAIQNKSAPPYSSTVIYSSESQGFHPRGVVFGMRTLGAIQTATMNIRTLAEYTTCAPNGPPPVDFVPPDIPDAPDIDPPDDPPIGCTNDEICAKLDSLVEALALVVARVTAIQHDQSEHIVLDVNTNDYVHAHLPVDIEFPEWPELPAAGGSSWGAPPYEKGITHGPLYDSGALTIYSLLGVQVGISARPGSGLVLEGQPAYLWDMGWMSTMNDDGMLEEKRITREGQVWMPLTMTLATSFTYTLKEGVELYVTELVPVPIED